MSRYWEIYLHIVWGTKSRSHVLFGELEIAAHKAIRDTVRAMNMVPICVNSAWNHTHSLISWNLAASVDDAVAVMKAAAVEAWEELREEKFPDKPPLEWQEGFAAFSVSPKKVQHAKKYVFDQKTLHGNANTLACYEIWSAG